MKAVLSFETLIPVYQVMKHCISENHNSDTQCCESLNSHVFMVIWVTQAGLAAEPVQNDCAAEQLAVSLHASDCIPSLLLFLSSDVENELVSTNSALKMPCTFMFLVMQQEVLRKLMVLQHVEYSGVVFVARGTSPHNSQIILQLLYCCLGKKPYGSTPSISPLSCYTSPSSVPFDIPLQLSSHSVLRNINVDNYVITSGRDK